MNPAMAADSADTVEESDCELFLREYEQAYAALRETPDEWAEVEEERRAFDGSLMDGLSNPD